MRGYNHKMSFYRGWSVVMACGILATYGLSAGLGSYQPALWCLVALEGVAAVSVLGGRAFRGDD